MIFKEDGLNLCHGQIIKNKKNMKIKNKKQIHGLNNSKLMTRNKIEFQNHKENNNNQRFYFRKILIKVRKKKKK